MKRNPQRQPVLPVELLAIQEQLRTKDGRFRFQLAWRLAHKEGWGYWYQFRAIRGRHTLWSAGSVEELLHAISAAEVAMEGCAGVRREGSQRRWNDQQNRCPRCGRLRKLGEEHTEGQCAGALKQAEGLIRGVGRGR
jgi:hypothetical protein